MVCSWYAVTTKSQAEERAARELKAQDFETSLPLARTDRRRRDGLLVAQTVPLFRGYLFVKFDPETDPWRAIYSTYGVRGILGYEIGHDRPTPVREPEMEALFAYLSSHGGIVELKGSRPRYIEPGTMIRIILGPYSDRFATVKEDRGARIHVLLDFMGAPRKARLTRECVELAGEPVEAIRKVA